MKSLLLLALVALAALTPDALASHGKTLERAKTDPNTTLPLELRDTLMSYLTENDRSEYAQASSASYKTVMQLNHKYRSVFNMLLRTFKEYKMSIPDDTGWSIVAAMKHSGGKHVISLGRLISEIGFNKLQDDYNLMANLARFAIDSPDLGTKSNGIVVTTDPHSLIRLARAADGLGLTRIAVPYDIITVLFLKNTAQFSNSLKIDEKWINDGSLAWFVESLTHGTLGLRPGIRFSREDISAMFCSIIYSMINPQVLARKSPLTLDVFTAIIDWMKALLNAIGSLYDSESVQVPRIAVFKLGRVMAAPVPYDITTGGIKKFLALHSSTMALAAGLVMLLGDADSRQPMYGLGDIIKWSTRIVGIDPEDWWWATNWQKVLELNL